MGSRDLPTCWLAGTVNSFQAFRDSLHRAIRAVSHHEPDIKIEPAPWIEKTTRTNDCEDVLPIERPEPVLHAPFHHGDVRSDCGEEMRQMFRSLKGEVLHCRRFNRLLHIFLRFLVKVARRLKELAGQTFYFVLESPFRYWDILDQEGPTGPIVFQSA